MLKPLQITLSVINACWSGIPWCCTRAFIGRIISGESGWGVGPSKSLDDIKQDKDHGVGYRRCEKCRDLDVRVRVRHNGALPDLLNKNWTGGWVVIREIQDLVRFNDKRRFIGKDGLYYHIVIEGDQ